MLSNFELFFLSKAEITKLPKLFDKLKICIGPPTCTLEMLFTYTKKTHKKENILYLQ